LIADEINNMPKINLSDLAESDFDEVHWGRKKKRQKQGRHSILDQAAQYQGVDPVAEGSLFSPTFSSSRHEREWILNYLGPFYDDDYLTDVLRQVAGGKEATVYCCQAHPSLEVEWVAAKVYRPRQFRKLRNDARYKQDRAFLDEYGRVIRDDKKLLAIRKKTRYGKELSHTSWLQHEYTTLKTLFNAGVSVPEPIAMGDNAMLMEYFGELDAPAAVLNTVVLSRTEAHSLYERLMADVETMLACGRVHGDLSAFNVLYWKGDVKIIDFPQAVDPNTNREARSIFNRDILRLCEYFERYGMRLRADRLAMEIWERQIAAPPAETEILVDEEEQE
jgi:RIO kinase 1